MSSCVSVFVALGLCNCVCFLFCPTATRPKPARCNSIHDPTCLFVWCCLFVVVFSVRLHVMLCLLCAFVFVGVFLSCLFVCVCLYAVVMFV